MNKISIVIPIYNEKENIINLIEEIKYNLSNSFKFEIIVVDDFSTDGSYTEVKKKHTDIILIRNKKNLGQSHSIYIGVQSSNYDHIVTIDGDGQNPPVDIIKIANIYFGSSYKLVGGLRLKRKDNAIKKISSIIANKFRSFILKDKCIDTGCSLKIFYKKSFMELPFFNGMHRFLPALFLALGCETYYVGVGHRPRIKGKSKYGTIDRLIRGIKDLIKVLYLIKRLKK